MRLKEIIELTKLNETTLKQTGVYSIHSKDGIVYYGITTSSFGKRFNEHLYQLGRNQHKNPILQNYYNKHGVDSFVFGIVEVMPKELENEMLLLEEKLIAATPEIFCFNVAKFGSTSKGRTWTEEQKARRRGANNPMFGKGASRTGSNNPMYGKKPSAETLAKRSERFKHENHPNVKLTKEIVLSIRKEYRETTTSINELVERYKVSRSTISNIILRKSWLGLED